MFEQYNPNPKHARVGDCTVRAISKLTNQDWYTTFLQLCLQGYIDCDMPSSNAVWGAVLRKKGYVRNVPCDSKNCECTVVDFCRDHPHGKYLLALPSHVVCVCDGKYCDTWNSGDEPVVYFWYKKEDIE